jgi:Family of unknown function (DUF5677)
MKSRLYRKVDETLHSEDNILEASRQFLETLTPAIDAICHGIRDPGVTRRLMYRCIIERAKENLSCILFLSSSEHSSMSQLPLRPLCEDLIYGSWLRTLPAEQADRFVRATISTDMLKSLAMQDDFLPRFTSTMQAWRAGEADQAPRSKHIEDPEVRDISAHAKQWRKELSDLGKQMGWPGNRVPTIHVMAKQCDLEEIYNFFYYGTSKAVHSNLLQMARMAVEVSRRRFDISSKPVSPYYKTFSLAYGVYLVEEIFYRIMAPEFPFQCLKIDDEAHSVWLAFVLAGLARNEALPSLLTESELSLRTRITSPRARPS